MNNQIQYRIVGFEDEIERVRILLDRMTKGEADYRFLNFYAPGGFAKSYLMERIVEEIRPKHPVCLVQVKEYEEIEPFDRSGLLHQILEDFSARLDEKLPEDYQYQTEPEKLADMIVKMMDNAHAQDKISLLLIDDYDHIPLAESRWLERRLFRPLAELHSVGFVLTSEYELSFNDSFDFQLRLDIYEISTMTAENIARSFPDYRPLANEFYILSGGIVALVVGLHQLVQAMGITPETFQNRQQELKQRYFEDKAKPLVLSRFDPQVQSILLIVVILRRFDIRVLNTVLSEAAPELNWSDDASDFFSLIDALGSNVKWKKDEYGYVITPAVRRVFQEYVRFTDPDKFAKVNRLAVQILRDLLKEGYRLHLLLELIFHSIVLYRFEHQVSNDEKVGEQVSDELVKYLNDESASQMFEDDLDMLHHALEKDEEINSYINSAARDTITGYIRARLIEKRLLKNIPEVTPAEIVDDNSDPDGC